MKKIMLLVMVLALCLSTAVADMLPADVEVTYGDAKLDAPAYTDGADVYVSLEALMQLLGGTASEQDGKIVLALDKAAQPTAASNVIFEDDHITVTFNGFEYFSTLKVNGDITALPKIVITNKTNKAISFEIDWKKCFVNRCRLEAMNAQETEVAANSKLSFPNARVCVFNISDLKDYGETVIQHIEMDVKLTYGKKTKTETWVIDCNVPIDSIQPAQ